MCSSVKNLGLFLCLCLCLFLAVPQVDTFVCCATHNQPYLIRRELRVIWKPQMREEIVSRPQLRFFFMPGLNMGGGFPEFELTRSPKVYLPPVDISYEFDLDPSLVAYDPSFIDFPPPPDIPPSDGYKTQFVCDYDYDPIKDTSGLYKDKCFYYLYTPKKRRRPRPQFFPDD